MEPGRRGSAPAERQGQGFLVGSSENASASCPCFAHTELHARASCYHAPQAPDSWRCLPSSSYFSGKGGGRFGGGTHCPSWVKRVPPANPHTLRVTLSGGRGLSRWSICRGPCPLRAIIGHPRTAKHQGLHDSPWSRPSLAETLTSVQSRGDPTRGLGGFHEMMAKKSIVYPAVSEGTAPQMRLRPRLIIIMTMTMTDQNINPLTPHTF